MIRRFGRTLLLMALTAVTVAIATLALVTQLGPLWHLFRGNTLQFASWTVPVPKAYFTFPSSSDSMFRIGLPFWSAAYGHISLFEDRDAIGRKLGPAEFERGIAG